ncbi:MAG: TonB family protein [Myxococcota bacterium]|jgi:TonB family protein
MTIRPGAALTALLFLLAPVAIAEDDPIADASAPRPTARERLSQIAQRVQGAAIYPPIAQARGVAGESIVTFEIARNGAPENVRTQQSSGSVSLDRAAEQAVARAAPLPWIHGEVTVPVQFVLRGPD